MFDIVVIKMEVNKVNANDISEKDKKELRECRLEEELSNFFKSRGIEDWSLMSLYIKTATGEIARYYSGGQGEMDAEELYMDDKALFPGGTWRLFLSKS